MHSAEHNDLRPFYKAHPTGGAEPHDVVVVATDQVNLVCVTCGFSVTQDAVDAGLPVTHEVAE